MILVRRIAYLLVPVALLGMALASAGSSAAFEPPPPTPTVEPTDAGPSPSAPTGEFLLPPPGCPAVTPFVPHNTTRQEIPDSDGFEYTIITSTIHITTTGTYLWQLVVTTAISHSDSGELV